MKKIRRFPLFVSALLLATALVSCKPTDSGLWDNLGGGSEGASQDSADMSAIENLENKEDSIIEEIDDNQKDTDGTGSTAIEYTGKKITISEPGDYTLTGEIEKQVEVTSSGVKIFLNSATITNVGKKVISSDEDIIIVLVEGTTNYIVNTGEEAAEANAISGSGKVTINGSGKLVVNATKSAIKADGAFYGLGGDLILSAGTGHGISADSIILTSGKISVTSAAKDGLHAETEDDILIKDPFFADTRGYFYIDEGADLTISGVYGDGIQADTFALIKGGDISITTLPTFIQATSSEGAFRFANGVYSRVAVDEARNFSSLYQLSQSNKGIKVGEIDYEDADENEYIITENTAYSLIVAGGDLTINTTDDALHTNSGDLLISDGNITITTSDDAVAADKNVKITGGNLVVSASYEGIEGETIEIAGGVNKITASDDGINASSDATTAIQRTTCYIRISGGVTYVNSSGDGVDSNGGVLISDGELYVYGPTSGRDASLDSDAGIIIAGGKLITVGSSGMVETPSTNSTQHVVSINLSSSLSGKIEVKEGNTVLASFEPSTIFNVNKSYQSVVVSLPSFQKSKSYSFITGTKTTSATISSIITKVGQAAGPGGPGGPR